MMSTNQQQIPSSSTAQGLVGEILDQRYVVVEYLGEADRAHLFAVYDMHALERTQVRVSDPCGDGQGIRFEVVCQAAPETAAGAAPVAVASNNSKASAKKKAQNTRRGLGSSKNSGSPKKLSSLPPPVATAKALVNVAPPSPAVPSEPAAPSESLPKLILVEGGASKKRRDPTEQLDLATAEIVESKPTTPRKRVRTSAIEAAWFAHGKDIEDIAEVGEEAELQMDDEALQRRAARLSQDTLNRFALETGSVQHQSKKTGGYHVVASRHGRVKPLLLGALLGLVGGGLILVLARGVGGDSQRRQPASTNISAEKQSEGASAQRSDESVAEAAKQRNDERKTTVREARSHKALGRRARRRVRRQLAQATRAFRRDRYRQAHAMASRVLRVDPGNRRAAGIKARAGAKLGL